MDFDNYPMTQQPPEVVLAMQLWLGRPLSEMEMEMSPMALRTLGERYYEMPEGMVKPKAKDYIDTLAEIRALTDEDRKSLLQVIGMTREQVRKGIDAQRKGNTNG